MKKEERAKKKVSQARTERIEDRQGRTCTGFRRKDRCSQTGMGARCLMSACFQMTGRGFSCVLASLAVMAARTPWLGRIVPGKVGFHLISS